MIVPTTHARTRHRGARAVPMLTKPFRLASRVGRLKARTVAIERTNAARCRARPRSPAPFASRLSFLVGCMARTLQVVSLARRSIDSFRIPDENRIEQAEASEFAGVPGGGHPLPVRTDLRLAARCRITAGAASSAPNASATGCATLNDNKHAGITMANESVAQLLLRLAWKRLWKPGTPYYLPNVLVNGASGNGKHVAPLGSRPVPALGPFDLASQDPWGHVSITLRDGAVDGLQTAADGGFTYDDKTSAYTAKIAFGQLAYRAPYAVDGDGLLGCALSGASALLQIIGGADAALAAPQAAGDSAHEERIRLANEYQDRLVQSPAGLSLVGTYYDNNWAMNQIVRDPRPNAFLRQWANEKTSQMARLTQGAAQAPEDPSRKIGDDEYTLASYKRGVAFKKACVDKSVKQDDSDPFWKAGVESNAFHGLVERNHDGPTTVGHVMAQVANSPPSLLDDARARYREHMLAAANSASVEMAGDLPATLFRTSESAALYRRAYDEVMAEEAAYAEQVASGAVSEAAAGAFPVAKGNARATFGAPAFTMKGTITVTGNGDDLKLRLTLAAIEANLPRLSIDVQPFDWFTGKGDQRSLYDLVSKKVAQARFIQDLLRKKIDEKLSDAKVLGYLQDRINDAIDEALGKV
ncbi:hypothetical protein [Burkholderia pseudomallei]|uniref:hypothetical protein n=1 Tax=Burkholderia pseudomallei TaxID=28450 RepID=UPI000AA3FAB2|nr:hypothetical protein [Burkholderia pseudomallei]